MSDAASPPPPPPLGTVGWFDLTVADAEGVRDFYEAVAGWSAAPLDMGGYADYVMTAPGGQSVAGICHARGANASLPAQWLLYITVADLDASMAACTAKGGEVISGPRKAGPTARFCVVRDPAGAVAALFANDVKPA